MTAKLNSTTSGATERRTEMPDNKYPLNKEDESKTAEEVKEADKDQKQSAVRMPPPPMMMTVYAGPDFWNGGAFRAPGAPAQESKVGNYCPECGFPVKENDNYCTECGAKLKKA